MENWLAAGDETGGWDIVNGGFETSFVGLAWALAPVTAWEKALRMEIGGRTALDVFSSPFSQRLSGVRLPAKSPKYHILDIWSYCNEKKLFHEVSLDTPQDDPVLELLRSDAAWLLGESGLGVLAMGGNAGDAKAAGLGLSGDGLRERARAYAGLMTVALPFLPGDASLNMLVEGRLELEIADAVKSSRFAELVTEKRVLEPFRDFLGRLNEDIGRASERCQGVLGGGKSVREFSCKGSGVMASFMQERLRGMPFFKSNAETVVKAMLGIADLAAALVPRPDGKQTRLVVPAGMSANLWAGNFRELRHAIHG